MPPTSVGVGGGFPQGAGRSGSFGQGGMYQPPYGQTGFLDRPDPRYGPQRITPPPAPPVSTFTDDFTTQDTTKWTGWGANVAVATGRLQVTTTPSYLGVTSAQLYTLRDTILTVEIVQLPNLGTGSTSAYLQAVIDGSNVVGINWEGGTLHAFYTIAGTRNDVNVPYNATAHKIWRLRESGGTLYFEASSSGAAWTNIRAPIVTPLDLSAISVVLNSGYYGTEATPGSAIFDNVNATYADPPPAPRTIYVDPAGSDGNDGLSTATPWATISKVSNTVLYPGDTVYFKRDGTWTGNLALTSSGTAALPITVTAYGTGALPILTGGGSSGVAGTVKPVEIFGSFVTVDGIEVRGSSGTNIDVIGADCAVQNCTLRWGVVGVHQNGQAARLDVLHNTFTDINVGIIGPGTNDDTGANGVVLDGDSAEVAYNTMTGCYFVSPDYGLDGSAIDIYGATNAVIHHNTASQTIAFLEIGNPASDNNFAYDNVFTSTLTGVGAFVVHGALYDDGSVDPFGPVTRTRLYHNTVVATGGDAATGGVWTGHGGELDLQNNIIVVSGSAFMAGMGPTTRPFTEAGNVFWNTTGPETAISFPSGAIDPTSTIADPLFVSSTDLRLQPGSPAIDRGGDVGVGTDYLGVARPVGAAPDAGAYESAIAVAAAADFTGSGDLTATTTLAVTQPAALAGSGALTATQTPAAAAPAALTGSGTLASTQTRASTTAAPLTGTGALTAANGLVAVTTPAALTGSGALVVTNGTVTAVTTAPLSGSGALAATTTLTAARTATLTGAGTLTASQTAAATQPAALTGAGSLTASTAPAVSAPAALTGSGALTSTQAVATATTVGLSGSGTLTGTQAPAAAQSASLSGTGGLSAAASAILGALSGAGELQATYGSAYIRTAALDGAGTLTATGTPAVTSTATLAGTGSLTGTTSAAGVAPADLAGSGALSATLSQAGTTTAALAGAGALTATTTTAGAVAAPLTGSGVLDAGVTPRTTQPANLTGTGALAAEVTQNRQATANLSGLGALTAVATASLAADAHLTGMGILAALGVPALSTAAPKTGSGALAATITRHGGATADIEVDAYDIPRGWHVTTVRRGWRTVALRNDVFEPAY